MDVFLIFNINIFVVVFFVCWEGLRSCGCFIVVVYLKKKKEDSFNIINYFYLLYNLL